MVTAEQQGKTLFDLVHNTYCLWHL